jgi:4'-phosphopantetheinyl transferase
VLDLWYINIGLVSQELYYNLLKLLPVYIQQDILRYKFLKDQKLKLFAKLLICKYHQEKFAKFDWSNWKNDLNGKPFLIDGMHFNIAHSGDYVLVAFSDRMIGIDLEKNVKINVDLFLDFLHVNEKEYILKSNTKQDAFYEVWTRKEAYLKSIGVGLKNGLNNENCLNTIIIKNNVKWFIYSLPLIDNYKIAICTSLNKVNMNSFEISSIDIDEVYL